VVPGKAFAASNRPLRGSATSDVFVPTLAGQVTLGGADPFPCPSRWRSITRLGRKSMLLESAPVFAKKWWANGGRLAPGAPAAPNRPNDRRRCEPAPFQPQPQWARGKNFSPHPERRHWPGAYLPFRRAHASSVDSPPAWFERSGSFAPFGGSLWFTRRRWPKFLPSPLTRAFSTRRCPAYSSSSSTGRLALARIFSATNCGTTS
jgi:hypothetical protein